MAMPGEEGFDPYNDWDGSLLGKPIQFANTWALKKYFKDVFFGEMLGRVARDGGTHILDIGCGACSLMRFYQINYRSQSSKVWRYLGVDGDESNLDRGLDYVESMPQSGDKKAMDLYLGNLSEKKTWKYVKDWIVDEGKEGYDVIIATEIVEHFPRSFAVPFLKQLVKLLAPGGRIFFSTPVHYDDTPLFWPEENYHYFEYKREELEKDLEEAGLAVESIHGNCIDTKTTKQLFKANPVYKEMHKKRAKLFGAKVSLVLTDLEMCVDLDRPEYYTAVLKRR